MAFNDYLNYLCGGIINIFKSEMMSRNILYVCLCVLAFSCGRGGDERVDHALGLAGDNRAELQRVLDHYSDDAGKLEAARFLISNMPGHCSMSDDGTLRRYYVAVDSIVEAMAGRPGRELCDSIDAVARRMDFSGIAVVEDATVVTSEFLIENIDRAFAQWREGQWARHLTFDEFCEYLLPYKAYEMQPLDEWRSMYAYVNDRHLAHIKECDMLAYSPYFAAEFLQRYMSEKYHYALTPYSPTVPVYDARVGAKLPVGDCGSYSDIGVAVSRSVGIPVATDFSPVRSNENVGHSWNALLLPSGKPLAYNALIDNPSHQHMPEAHMPKVYRCTFASNRDLIRLNNTGGYVPPMLRNIFLKDVTGEYMETGEATVIAPTLEVKYLYLAAANGADRVVVDYAPLKGGKARFDSLGLDCVYMPVYFDNDGAMHNAGYPFYLARDHSIRVLKPDTALAAAARLDRKYPVREYVHHTAMKTWMGRFEAAADGRFDRAVTVAEITTPDSRTHDVVVPDSVGAKRCWRYRAMAPDSFGNMAEITFYDRDSGEELRGAIISDGNGCESASTTPDKAFDGNLLTYYGSTANSGAWVGMDFGRPVDVGRIRYTPRGDGNNVEPGDTYELLCYDSEGWRSLGQQTASELSVVFDNVPADALLLLVDRTKGSEHRIFTMENGRQHFR